MEPLLLQTLTDIRSDIKALNDRMTRIERITWMGMGAWLVFQALLGFVR